MVYRVTSSGKVRKNGSAPARSSNSSGTIGQNAFSPFMGFHADEDNGLTSPRLVTDLFALCHVSPQNANGAMALWRHLTTANYSAMLAQRQAAAALGYEEPTIIFVPFTEQFPGTNDPAQNDAVIAALVDAVDLYLGENIICGFGNLTAANFMVDATAAERRAAWFALEARAISEVFIPAGLRWCSTDDQGIAFLCSTMVERRAAWTLAGIDPTTCYFHCTHSYIVSGWVPVHYKYAQASLARIGVTTPIRITELAYGFLGAGVTHADKPWLLNEYLPGNTDCPPGVGGSECPPHSLTWTTALHEWCRTEGVIALLFDDTMKIRHGSLSTWGVRACLDQELQPAFAEPTPGMLWFQQPDAQNLAYNLAYNNQVDSGEVDDPIAVAAGTAAYNHVAAGNLFFLP